MVCIVGALVACQDERHCRAIADEKKAYETSTFNGNGAKLMRVHRGVQGRGKSSGSLETMYVTTNGNHCKQAAKQCWELSRHKGGDFPAGQISRANVPVRS